MKTSLPSEADILECVLNRRSVGFTPALARKVLQWQFDNAAKNRIRRLLDKNSLGTITSAERDTLGSYVRVGQLIDLIHAQARISLKRSKQTV